MANVLVIAPKIVDVSVIYGNSIVTCNYRRFNSPVPTRVHVESPAVFLDF
jgi:hypothetical protein